jgi:hypothetical protein
MRLHNWEDARGPRDDLDGILAIVITNEGVLPEECRRIAGVIE